MSSLDKAPDAVAALYTEEISHQIELFAGYMKEHLGGSATKAARLLGCNHTTVSRLLRHIYPGDVVAQVQRMEEVRKREAARRRIQRDPPHAEIATTKAVSRTMLIAHLERRMAAVLGGTGIGKTVAVRQYAAANDHVACVVGGCTGSKQALARRIAQAVHVPPTYRADTTLDRIVEALTGTDWLLVVDEIDEVPPESLRLLREIHDAAHVGIVIVGTEGFLEGLRAKGSRVINQFLGRVAYVARVGPLGRDDVQAIAEPYGLETEAFGVLVEAAAGQARRVAMLLVNAQRSNGQHVTAKAIRRARTELMPVLGNGKHV